MLSKQSGIISVLRFPMIVGVVFIHTLELSAGQFPIYDFLYSFLTDGLCGVCVPLFFFFSGYLFFQNIECLNMTIFWEKIKKRARSLLIPFIFWNLFVVAIIGIGQLVAPSLFSGAYKNVLAFSVEDWLSIFYSAFGSNQPIAFQLWFLRDLIIMVVLTPLFYYLCKYLRFWWLPVLFILSLFGIRIIIPGLNIFSLSFFCTGCWFGINRTSFSFKSDWVRWTIIVAYFLSLVIEIVLYGRIKNDLFNGINTILGCVAIVQLTAIYLEQCETSKLWYMKKYINNSTFFIFCYHGIFSAFLGKAISPYVSNDVTAIMGYFGIVFILVIGGILAYNLLLAVLPRFTAFITGGRN